MGGYEPKMISSNAKLPKNISAINKHWLSEFFGAEADKFEFAFCRITNRRELLAQVPDAKDYKWKPPVFQTLYNYRPRNSLGLKEVMISIQLDEKNELIEAPEFPKCAKNPKKCQFLTYKEAMERLEKSGNSFSNRDVMVQLTYDKKWDELVWQIDSQYQGDENYSVIRGDRFFVSASSGELLKSIKNGVLGVR